VTSGKRESRSEPFQYTAVLVDGGEDAASRSGPNGAGKAEIEQRERESYERGVREGEAKAAATYRSEISAVRALMSQAVEAFGEEREAYFRRIEPEVLQLALAIARKILHREAQMDPLLLTGMVHVALEKLDSGTCVRMRVNPSDVHSWNEYLSQSSAFRQRLELVGDQELQHGECALETEIGSTVISLETQLKEIEQGFFDLLEQRPRVR
jgi:flagellar assembly protein FliH